MQKISGFHISYGIPRKYVFLFAWIIMTGCTNHNNIFRFDESAAVLRIRADADQTTAGGFPINLAAEHNMDGESVTWDIDPQSPGKLDEINGRTVHYLPPAAGSISAKARIAITATVNGITQHIELILQPWPAAILSVQLGTGPAAT